jgi:eukaryotic-like serine/threonine-protein kinase
MTDDANAPTALDSGPGPGLTPTVAPPSPDPRYEIRRLLGRGGMGEVWLAYDQRVDREIAIKLMRRGVGSDADAITRFVREARVQGQLEHPSVVPVHDVGGEPAPYLAMKRLTGTTLADVLAAGDHERWPRRTLLARFVDVCLAVEFAHRRGVIHRDLKPANIMLGDFGEAYVLDWGLARVATASEPAVSTGAPVEPGHTEAGALLGTPGYMAPEQVRGEPLDARADVFALGCILYELLAGRPAIPRERALAAAVEAACHRPSTTVADVPPELDDACAHATAADHAARMPTARALADAVQRFLDGDRDLERRRVLAAEHAGRAAELFARGDEPSRADAMREAGSAIALDPSNRDAQALLARLLLEPPPQLPAEARQRIDAERERAGRVVARNATWVYLGFLALLPVVKALGVDGTWPFLVVGAQMAALAGMFAYGAWRRAPPTGALAIAVLAGHLVLLVTIGVVLGPLILMPILIFGSYPIAMTGPLIRNARLVTALHLIALAAPFAIEWLGLIPRTFALSQGKLVLAPWALDVGPHALVFTMVATLVIQLVGSGLIYEGQRRTQERAQELVHVQAWRLGQLVPASAVARPSTT